MKAFRPPCSPMDPNDPLWTPKTMEKNSVKIQGRPGFELVTFCVERQCGNHYTNGPMCQTWENFKNINLS